MEQLELAKEIGMTIAQIIIAFFFCKQYLSKYLKKTNVAEKLPKQNKLDMEIIDKMEYAKEILNADRIHVYEFHNGENWSNHRPAYKFSCTYEVFKAGNNPIQNKCVGLLTNCMPLFVDKIIKENKFICEDLEDLKDAMPSTYNFKKALNIKSFYDVAIKNKDDKVIGFVAIHWFKKSNVKIDEDVIKQLVWYVEEHLINSK